MAQLVHFEFVVDIWFGWHKVNDRVTECVVIIESWMNKRGGDGEGSDEVSGVMDAVEVTNMVVRRTVEWRDLLEKITGRVQDEADIFSRGSL